MIIGGRTARRPVRDGGTDAGGGRGLRGSSPSRRPMADAGSASIEFLALGVLLLVPLAYLIMTIFTVQSAAYGVSGAAREAGRAFVRAGSEAEARTAAYEAAWVALQDHGVALEPDQLVITCSATPCLTPGGVVRVDVAIDVGLPFVPPIFGEVPASVSVEGRHAAVVDLYRGGG
jgi:hypothetical protein